MKRVTSGLAFEGMQYMVEGSMVAGVEGSWSHGACSQEAEMNTGTQLPFPYKNIHSGTAPMAWYCSRPGQAYRLLRLLWEHLRRRTQRCLSKTI